MVFLVTSLKLRNEREIAFDVEKIGVAEDGGELYQTALGLREGERPGPVLEATKTCQWADATDGD